MPVLVCVCIWVCARCVYIVDTCTYTESCVYIFVCMHANMRVRTLTETVKDIHP